MTPCGHPLAARRIVVTAIGPRAEDRRLWTDCWACAVEREIVSKIFGPKRAKENE